MIIRFFITFLIVFWFLSCAKDYGDGGNFNPNLDVGLTPVDQSSTSSCKEWGGVTCTSGGDRDQSFLDFLSNGTLISSVGNISCTPSASGGIIFKLKVTFNAPFRIGSNSSLVMQPASSTLEIQIMDSRVGAQTGAQVLQPIGATFQGESGTINGNKADLRFIYNGNDGWKKLRMEGVIEGNLFKGRAHFENEKYCASFNDQPQCQYTTPGRKGTLGNFISPICPSTFIPTK